MVIDSINWEIFFIAAVILLAWNKWKLGYWKRKGLPGPPPLPIIGNIQDLLFKEKTIGEFCKDVYLNLKPKGIRHAGIYFFGAPKYMPCDLELIKRIMQTDFHYFHSHGIYSNEESDPLSANIFTLDGHKWKNARNKLTPTFTTGKIKMVYKNIVECSTVLNEVLEEASRDHPVDIKDIMARFTTDVLGHFVLGSDINSLKNPNAEFRKYSQKLFDGNLIMYLTNVLPLIFPHSLLKAFKYKSLPEDVTTFFYHVVESTIKYRKENNIFRNDILNILMELKNDNDNFSGSRNCLTLDEIAAQCFLFFIAGYETTSSTINFASYELSIQTDIQEKVREEIDEVLKKYNNLLTYDAIMEMEYLNNVVQETLRKYPTFQFLFRKCTKDYLIKEDNVVIDEGTYVMIPVLGIHNDPEYFPDPERFNPDRFNEQNRKTIPAFAYLPFGEGPRICMGLRFGMLQTKIGLITLIRNFKFKLNKKTISPIVFNRTGVVTTSKGGIWLDLEKIDTNL